MWSLVVGQLDEAVVRVPPPNAFTGAVRHALTIGFMATRILGVGQRLLSVLEHASLRQPALVAPILTLIAVGNLLRVSTQLATMWAMAA